MTARSGTRTDKGGRLSRAFGASLALLACASPVLAQSVEGSITDRASGLPVPGMLVFLLDSTGSATDSTLSGERGEYRLSAGRPGTYRLRASAVGFLSEMSPAITVAAGETATFAFVFGSQPRRLPPVQVVERRQCVSAPEAGAAVAARWDEVRKALTATQLTAESARYRFNLRQYERELDLKTLGVRRSRSWERTGLSEEPYGSLPADSLANHGYVQTRDGETWYYAPEARTLLSEAFARTHCFTPADPQSDRRGMVGLGFEPVGRRPVPDVRGVLWLDARTAELQFLEFSYTGLPLNLRDHAFGGRVEFDRLPTGAWVVERWYIRMPKLERATRYRQSEQLELGVPPRLTPLSGEVVAAIIERGGEVTAHVPAGMPLATRSYATVDGSAYDSLVLAPLAGAEIWLEVPGQAVPAGRTSTDSAGRFTFDSVAAGRYTLSVSHGRLDTLGASLDPVSLALERGDAVTVSFTTPSLAAVARSACSTSMGAAGFIRGSVRRGSGGAPVPGATVTARWEALATRAPGAATGPDEASSQADAAGLYTLCGIPHGRPVELRAAEGSSPGEPVILSLDSASVTIVDLIAVEGSAMQRGTAVLTGRVSGADARPLSGAEVRVLPSESAVRTDEGGAYRLLALAAGRQLMEVRAVGYAPVRRIVKLTAAATDTVNVWLTEAVRTLDTVTTNARRDPYRRGFYDRMERNAGGHFLTPEKIRASASRRISDILASVPGVRIRKAGQVSIIELTGRGVRSGRGCPVRFVLDGVAYEPAAAFGLDGEIGLDDIEAIEVYDAATVPAQFSRIGASCGVVLLWTREKSVQSDKPGEAEPRRPEVQPPADREPRRKP